MDKIWWKESVVYQIYPRSFKDSKNDGIGDLPGIIGKLDYIKSLGIDIIWICPIYKSPNDDNGYDVSDYCEIMDEFGTMEDFDLLLNEVHHREMKLVLDLVPNHTSDEHRWFEEAKKSRDNPYRDYYYWKPGRDGGPPNNWQSFFGGSAWEYESESEEYYLHLFTKKQPDLNWENPKVREEIYKIIEFWFEKGIDGFRMDVISLISKNLSFPDTTEKDFGQVIKKLYANGPRVHEFIREMNDRVLSKYEIMTVGEGPGIDLINGPDYVAPHRNELNMIFHFDHMFLGHGPGGKFDPVEWNLKEFKDTFTKWDKQLDNNGWGSIFLGNHDFARIVSRFGNDDQYHKESAKLLATLLLSLRGTVYIYQGDEIGMTNVAFPSIDDYRDVEIKNGWNEALAAGKDMEKFLNGVHAQGRDNARTPIQWSAEKHGGFSNVQPWIQVNPNHDQINVDLQENDPDSILNYYRIMIQFRKDHPTLVYGHYECIMETDENIYAYIRSDEQHQYLILLNFSNAHLTVEHTVDGNIIQLIGNYTEAIDFWKLRPWESKILAIS